MKSDAEEILDEIQNILDVYLYEDSDGTVSQIQDYIHQKRLEFVEPQGDCV